MKIKVGVFGASGRMGQNLLNLIFGDDAFELSGAYEKSGNPQIGKDAGILIGKNEAGIKINELPEAVEDDVIIDFSLPEGTSFLLDNLLVNPTALVSGTTGIGEEIVEKLDELSEKAPVIWASNFSTGVNLLFDLVERAARALGENVEAEVTEIHHVHKKDAPSGTAVTLVERLARAINTDLENDVVHGRAGHTGERPKKQIGVHAIRGGEVFGEHTVHLFGNAERIELTHKLESRTALAAGAIKAAKWLANKENGSYSMADVLNL